MIGWGMLTRPQSPEAWMIGGDVGLAIVVAGVVGVILHVLRFLLARSTSNEIEKQFIRAHGRTSGQAQAMGAKVEMVRRPAVEALTGPRDTDLLVQIVIGVGIAYAGRF
jgi:hypothetical protein